MGAKNMEEIAELFQSLKFKKKLLSGIDERDVWKKLEMVQNEYRFAYEVLQERYEARLREREEEIASLRAKLPQEMAHE